MKSSSGVQSTLELKKSSRVRCLLLRVLSDCLTDDVIFCLQPTNLLINLKEPPLLDLPLLKKGKQRLSMSPNCCRTYEKISTWMMEVAY